MALLNQQTGDIKAIDRTSVHRICSGQVIHTLATAVKELVENSIDAGATNIEIKLKEFGKDSIEVSDNGCGVKSSDYQNLTLKHHTSKLGDFSDLLDINTFGFRGEALSSLCALGKLTIITCHKESDVGDRLDYDRNGIIINKVPIARQTGTTVIIENLFATLPVRHKEFLKNLKKEYSKMIQVLTAYCLISKGKRITCVNNNGKKLSNILSTNGDHCIKGNIACIYGNEQVNNLMEFIQKEPSNDILEEYNITHLADESHFKIEGYLSPCMHGKGRSTSDRQFFFINGRPCDLPKVAKVINDAYHSFNRHQYPFICLNIELLKDNVDVNVTPDKRQIFLASEKTLLATIKTSVLAMYEHQPSILKHCDLPQINSSLVGSPPTLDKSGKRSLDDFSDLDFSSPVPKSPRLGAVVNGNAENPNYSPGISDLVTSQSERDNTRQILPHISCSVTVPVKDDFKSKFKRNSNLVQSNLLKNQFTRNLKKSYSFGGPGSSDKISSSTYSKQTTLVPVAPDVDLIIQQHKANLKECLSNGVNDIGSNVNNNLECIKNEKSINPNNIMIDDYKNRIPFIIDEHKKRKRKNVNLDFQIEDLKRDLKAISISNKDDSSEKYRKFRSKINAKDAETELIKEISKDMFAKMEIIGQFNHGFIITKYEDDLFIVDQHATDEKYNFEILERETILETQKLLNPQTLELTVDSETILMDNLSVFEKNGFKFNVSEADRPGHRFQLISVPVSQNWNFGKDDVDELIFMLTDNSGKMCRPSRVCQMFASRACRKSIMIGTPLSHQIMKKLVCHMGEIEQPWNCPHGRPTMRHLFNLNLLRLS